MLSRTLLRRPLLSSLPASPAQLSLARLRLPAAHPYAALSARYAAGQVSNKPGAEDLSHAATNIKEELGAFFLCSKISSRDGRVPGLDDQILLVD